MIRNTICQKKDFHGGASTNSMADPISSHLSMYLVQVTTSELSGMHGLPSEPLKQLCISAQHALNHLLATLRVPERGIQPCPECQSRPPLCQSSGRLNGSRVLLLCCPATSLPIQYAAHPLVAGNLGLYPGPQCCLLEPRSCRLKCPASKLHHLRHVALHPHGAGRCHEHKLAIRQNDLAVAVLAVHVHDGPVLERCAHSTIFKRHEVANSWHMALLRHDLRLHCK
mmetsp:Transcript_20655/g.45208  ORF Transcript_20655/g.45208 Transcript_20655/m.45208 type:complete len:226 (-) Transcript_20655:287-964(-)